MSQSFSLNACFSFLTILWYTFCFDDCHFLVEKKEKNCCIKKQCASFTLSNPFVLWRNPLFFSNKTFFLCSIITVLSASGRWKRVVTAYLGCLYVQIDINNGQKVNVFLPNRSIQLRKYRVQSQSLKLAWFDPKECHRVVALNENVLYRQQRGHLR